MNKISQIKNDKKIAMKIMKNIKAEVIKKEEATNKNFLEKKEKTKEKETTKQK